MKIVVNTPGGNIGRALTERLLDAGASVVLISRNRNKVADLVARGAELVEGSVDNPSVLEAAFRGADSVFWLNPPSYRPDANEWSRNTAQAAAEVAHKSGVKRAVVISSMGAHTGPGTGPVSALLAIEEAFRAAVPDVVVLRPGFFMENFLHNIATIQKDGAIYSPVPTKKAVPMVATKDIAARAAAFLLDPAWTGQRIVGVHGPTNLSYDDAARILSGVFGRPVRHVEVTVDQLHQSFLDSGAPAFIADSYREMYQAVIEGRMDPAEARSHETTTGTSLVEFARTTLLPALQKAEGTVDVNASALIARANELMTAWEIGDTETYRKRSVPSVRMTIPAYGLDVSGFDAVWGVRQSLKPLDAGPLDIHAMDTHALEGRAVIGLGSVISRKTGQFTQHSRVKFVFDETDRLVHYHQEIIWRASTSG